MYFFLVNPKAAGGKAAKVWSKVKRELDKRNIKYVSVLTNHTEEAGREITSWLSRRTRESEALVVVGGDGTLHHAVLTIAELSVPLGLIPAGSGNDMARSLGIPRNPLKALGVLLQGNTKTIDIIRMGQLSCMNVVGIGFDGEVARQVNHSWYKAFFNKLGLGSLAYVLALFQVLVWFKPSRMYVTVDNNEFQFEQVWLLAAANLPYYGGGMKICPQADGTDGVMDVCIIQGSNKWKLVAGIFPRIFSGRHLSHSAVTILRGRKVVVRSEALIAAHGDGEDLGDRDLDMEVIPCVVRIIC